MPSVDEVTIAADFVSFEGFEVTGSDFIGINVYGASNVRIAHNVIHHNTRGAIYAAPAEGRGTSDLEIEGNIVYRNSLDNSGRQSQGGWAGAIQTLDAHRLTVIDNRVYENWGEGISFTVTDGSTARGNVLYDNYSVQLYMDHATNSVFEGNLLYETGNQEFFRELNGAGPANGIQVSNEPGYASGEPARGNRIVNNIVIGGRAAFQYWRAGGDDTGLRDTLIAHNTFYGSREVLLKIDDNSHGNSAFINNLLVSSGSDLAWLNTAGLTFAHNAWHGQGAIAGAGDIKGDCGVTRPGGTQASDYALSSMDSPCVGAGELLSEVNRDFWGGVRTGRADIGAHQFGATPPPGMPSAGSGGTGSAGAAAERGGGSSSASSSAEGAGQSGAQHSAPHAAKTPSSDGFERSPEPTGCGLRSVPSGKFNVALALLALFALTSRRRRVP